jgi:hypothetical protein
MDDIRVILIKASNPSFPLQKEEIVENKSVFE